MLACLQDLRISVWYVVMFSFTVLGKKSFLELKFDKWWQNDTLRSFHFNSGEKDYYWALIFLFYSETSNQTALIMLQEFR